ncbi:MAG: pirin family protein, partial [Xanthomonadaceae bacterium]|nr:pirin family protein [Xanthomonadaceae bacterium]
EMPEQENGLMWGFQLWVNLPAKDKMTAPRYQDIAPEAIPETSPVAGATVRVIAGSLNGVAGPVSGIATEPVYFDVRLQAGAAVELPLPATHNGFAYVYQGQARIGEGASEQLVRGDLGVLGKGDGLKITTGDAPARLIVVAGKPLNEPVAKYGPFVMNTPQQIVQAVEDFRAGRF